MRQADVFGAGNGTLFGKMDISKAIRDGKAVILALKVSKTVARREQKDVWMNHLSYRLFLRTARLVGADFPFGLSIPLFRAPRGLGPRGEYGGERKPRAASQSKGRLAEIEGDSSGDRVIG
jgi:hypothetical protein